MRDITSKEEFDLAFLFTRGFEGKRFDSLEKIMAFMKTTFPDSHFFDYKIEAPVIPGSIVLLKPFNFIVAKQGSERISNPEYLGFKLDIELFYRLGPPFFEEKEQDLFSGDRLKYRLYESPEKKYELLTYR